MRNRESTLDAMLDAERELGVTGRLINFTATFSYAICANCGGNLQGVFAWSSISCWFVVS